MGFHRNARLGLAGRRALVADVEAGLSCRAAARRRGVSPTTACKWWRRWSEATLEQRLALSCLEDRSSRPHSSPRLLAAGEQARICAARRRLGWGPRLIAGETGHAHATVWRTLRRAGISRPPRQPREQPRLYEWPCPGDLLHIDSKRFVRFTRPGHAVTGDRHRTGAEKRMRIGYEWAHSIVDDHSRYAYSELHRTNAHRRSPASSSGRSRTSTSSGSSRSGCSPTTPSSTATTAPSASSSTPTGSRTDSSGHAGHRPTARSSATNKHSNEPSRF